jgi:NDP-sugar pyrophosphorylase family protein
MEIPVDCSNDGLWPNRHSGEGQLPLLTHSQPWMILQPGNQNGLKAQLDDLLQKIGSNLRPGVESNETNGPIHIDKTANIEPGVYIIGPAYIGPNASIRQGAYVRQYSWICSGAVVGHCSETKHSILLSGAKAPHFNYVGDSILGGGVNLGAGVKLSNLRNDGGNVNLRVGEEKIDSDLRKFGALLGEGCQLGCNAVTNPGVILGVGSFVHPNTTVTGIHGNGSIHR